VAVDIRQGSPYYGRNVSAVISESKWNQIFIPAGFAQGLVTLEENTAVLYKVSNYYSPEHDMGLLWNDPDLGIDRPVTQDEAMLSDKDLQQKPRFRTCPGILCINIILFRLTWIDWIDRIRGSYSS